MLEVDVLIDLVKARPPLYNSALIEYKSKAFSSILWKEIGDAMNKDVQQCRTIWTSLRSSYARHLQNMENNEKGINGRKKAKWYLADRMSFLNEFMVRTPRDRNITLDPNDFNNTTTVSGDDNSMSFANFEYRIENNNCIIDDNHSVVTVKSEDCESEMTLSSHSLEDVINQDDGDSDKNEADAKEIQAKGESPVIYYHMKKCRVELTSNDQNILTPKSHPKDKEISSKNDQGPVPKHFKMSSSLDEQKSITTTKTTTSVRTRDEIPDIKERENSTLLFFHSILFDLRKLPDRKLRLFKQNILQDLNKYLDEDENAY